MDRGRWTEPLKLRGIEIANRIWMSPMCQYSAGRDGVPTNWHRVHYGSRAVGGAGMIMVESTAVGPRHRTTPHDLGIWSGEQVEGHRMVAAQIKEFGSIAAIQLNSAGRKSSHRQPLDPKRPEQRHLPPGRGMATAGSFSHGLRQTRCARADDCRRHRRRR